MVNCARKCWSESATQYQRLSQDSPFGDFYAGLAQQFRYASHDDQAVTFSISGLSAADAIGKKSSEVDIQIPFQMIANHAKSAARQVSSRPAKALVRAEVLPLLNPSAVVSPIHIAAHQGATGESLLETTVQMQRGVSQEQRDSINGFFVEVKHNNRIYLHRVKLKEPGDGPSVGIFVISAGSNIANFQTNATSIRLRPSSERQAFDLRVENRLETQQKLVVSLNDGTATVTANVQLNPHQIHSIKFPGKPPKPTDPLPESVHPIAIQVHDAATKQLLAESSLSVQVAEPREYVEVVSAKFTPFSTSRNRLEVWLRLNRHLPGPPCIAELQLDASMIPGLISVEGGRMKTTLKSDGTPTMIYAENVILDERIEQTGTFSIAVDGVARNVCFFPMSLHVREPRRLLSC